MDRRSLDWWICLLFLTLLPLPLEARPKKDVIRFKNGDHWTCEIKKLDHGYLYVGLDYVDGDVSIDWREVVSIESPQQFVVIDLNGTVLVGPFATSTGPRDNEISLTVEKTTVPKSHVSSIQQTEVHFWRALHGGLSGGINFTKSESTTNFSFNANADFRREYWSAGGELQSTFTGSVAEKNNLRNQLSLNTVRLLNDKNYFAIAVGDLLHSDEQQLDLRSILGGGVGRLLVSTNNSRIMVLGGAVWTREKYTTAETNPNFNSAEGLLGTKLEYFRFKTANYSLNLYLYPSLTDPGRTRLDGNAGVRFKVFKDLTFNLNLYLNYDSRPPRATSKSDYGANSTIGWTF